MRNDYERLKDILEAINKIKKYANKGKKIFEQDELIQVWIIHHLQIIGEASAAMSQKLVEDNPEIPWQDMRDFRNILVHEYFRVDPEIIWSVVTRELPILKQKIKQIDPK
ncbi:MAG: DUF86 domain-containing protein [Pleurocapsa sp. SU_5_0]|nr:DUF86 domain-containing protein [Pleurocapsa sp. SU_5_0]NJO97145.1 DUF86 domain-containing protein [Pleurocapsa sp. CRU_1_2]NJR48010.1 DUF86 domain-containing protein [Hyellaceae cyanobacterium CSU_1_1]